MEVAYMPKIGDKVRADGYIGIHEVLRIHEDGRAADLRMMYTDCDLVGFPITKLTFVYDVDRRTAPR